MQSYLEDKYADPADAKQQLSFKMGQYLSVTTILSLFVLGCLCYWVLYLIVMRWIESVRPGKTQSNVKVFSYTASVIHATMGQFMFLHTLLIACSIPGKNFTSSPVCFDQTSAGMQIYLCLSLAYFACDIVTVKPFFKDQRGNMVTETYIHHTICILSMLGGIFIGRFVGVFVG